MCLVCLLFLKHWTSQNVEEPWYKVTSAEFAYWLVLIFYDVTTLVCYVINTNSSEYFCLFLFFLIRFLCLKEQIAVTFFIMTILSFSYLHIKYACSSQKFHTTVFYTFFIYLYVPGQRSYHTFRFCLNNLKRKIKEDELKLVPWSSQSLHLNQTDLVWDELDRKGRTKKSASATHLWTYLQCFKGVGMNLLRTYFLLEEATLMNQRDD